MRQIDNIVVHCTATSQQATVPAIQAHWRRLGWKSPGYHLIVHPNGHVTRLANDDQVTNGVRGHNANSLHISYIGGVDAAGKPVDNRTPQQKAGLLDCLRKWRRMYPRAEIKGHRDFPGVAKACPSFDARAEYKDI